MPGMTLPIVVTDMDGTLATTETWRGVLDWTNANYPSPESRRFVRSRLPAILVARTIGRDRERFKARWMEDQAMLFAGLPRARVLEMAAWVVDEHLWPARRQAAVDRVIAAIEQARSTDPRTRLVLASGAYQEIAEAFAARIGADLALGTPLAYRDDVAVGGTAVPTQTGVQKAAAVRSLADGGEILAAFGDTEPDIPLLSLATRAVAVAPDRALRRAAISHGWEILEA
jgi:phosphoserine phosphatase